MICKVCNQEFTGRKGAKFCSAKCRKSDSRLSVTDKCDNVTDNVTDKRPVTMSDTETILNHLRKYRCLITKSEYKCPKCGHDILIGRSAQVCVDGCEMWLECERCGYDPSPDEHVETVMGWQDDLVDYAKEIWLEKIQAKSVNTPS